MSDPQKLRSFREHLEAVRDGLPSLFATLARVERLALLSPDERYHELLNQYETVVRERNLVIANITSQLERIESLKQTIAMHERDIAYMRSFQDHVIELFSAFDPQKYGEMCEEHEIVEAIEELLNDLKARNA